MRATLAMVWLGGAALALAMSGGCAGTRRAARGVAPDFSGEFALHAVAADHPLASEAGLEVLRAGGNAVDAAVATSLALSVVRPFSCGIGGGGFMVIHFEPGQLPRSIEPPDGPVNLAINYREMAPRASTGDMFARPAQATGAASPSRVGALAVGVPGTVAGLLHAQASYGLLAREEVLAPAIRLAERGFEVDEAYLRAALQVSEDFEASPAWQTRFAFVWQRYLLRGRVALGDRIHVPEQAAALRLIARDGATAFYDGPIALAIERASAADGGGLTREDLRGYRVATGEPLAFGHDGRTFLTMPPPSSGGITMAQTLGVLARVQERSLDRQGPGEGGERVWAARLGPVGPGDTVAGAMRAGLSRAGPLFARALWLIEAFQLAFADRAAWLGDPAFVTIPLDRLLSGEYLDARAAIVDPASGPRAPAHYLDDAARIELSDDAGTSHLSVVDRWGNAVACTETINLEFGSLLAVPEYGFILNDQMDDFTSRVGEPNAFGLRQSARNLPGPGKRPLSSMTPTIVLGPDGRVEVVAGASGGPRIITGTIQAILHALSGWSAREAVAAPRLHHQWMPARVDIEPAMAALPGVDSGTLADDLRRIGYEVREVDRLCVVQMIRRADGLWQAASDPRKGGRPAGD